MTQNIYYCNARKRRCSQCGHKFTKAEHELWTCPECGTDRHCHAKVKQEGKRCRLHGGESVSGIASPTFKTGRYSKVLPAALAARYETSLKDEELLALRDEIALLDARLNDLLTTLKVGAARKLWDILRGHYEDLRAAMGRRDTDAAGLALRALGAAIDTGSTESESWAEIYSLIDQRRRLAESEGKRLVQMQQVITTEQALVLLSRIQQAIVENVTDKRALAAIAATISELANKPAG